MTPSLLRSVRSIVVVPMLGMVACTTPDAHKSGGLDDTGHDANLEWNDGAADGAPLPVLLVDVGGVSFSDQTKTTGRLRVIEEHAGTLADLDGHPIVLDVPIGIEYRGQWSLQFAKKGYSIELRDATGEDAAHVLLGMPAESDWVLRAGYYDRTLMRDALGFFLFRTVWGRYAPRYRFVELLVDQSYHGVYLLCEKIKRDRARVDLPRVAADSQSGDISGGYLLHIESNSDEEGIETASGRIWEFGYPNAAKITDAQRAYLQEFLDSFEESMDADLFSDRTMGYAKWWDVMAAVDFSLFQELARNTDGYTKSSYYQKLPDTEGGLLRSLPVWDNDLSFGNFANGTESTEGWLYEFDWNRPVPWWRRLWADPAFRRLAACRWQELRRGGLTSEAIGAKIEEFATHLETAQLREDSRWQLIGRAETRSAYVGETWEEDVAYLEDWVSKRLTWLDRQFSGGCQVPSAPPVQP